MRIDKMVHRSGRRAALLGLAAAALIAAAPLYARSAHADWWDPMSWNNNARHHGHGGGDGRLERKDARIEDRIDRKDAHLGGLERREATIDRHESRAGDRLDRVDGEGRGDSRHASELRQDGRHLEARGARVDGRIANKETHIEQLKHQESHLDWLLDRR